MCSHIGYHFCFFHCDPGPLVSLCLLAISIIALTTLFVSFHNTRSILLNH